MASGDRVIYLDNAASMPMCPAARDAFLSAVQQGLADANPSSAHGPGRRARAAVDEARERLGVAVGAAPDEIVFTSGGTEADNLALMGAALGARRTGGRRGVVVSAIEHHAILEAARALQRLGFAVEVAASGPDGVVPAQSVEEALWRLERRGDPACVVALMLVNNEVGTIQPVKAAGECAHRHGATLVVDAVQGMLVPGVDVGRMGCDVCALSAHKFGGPKGAGAVVVRRGVAFDPILFGGGQERALRPGTENVAAIVGMAAAAEWACERRPRVQEHEEALARRLMECLAHRAAGVELNAGRAPTVPGVMSLYVPGVDAEALLVELDMDKVACSYGAACSSGAMRPSHVLEAMGLPPDRVRQSIRVSPGPFNTLDEVEEAGDRMAAAIRRLRGRARSAEGMAAR